MKFKELVGNIATEFNMPAAEAKKIASYMLSQLKSLIDKKEGLSSPYLSISTRELNERTAINKNTGEQRVIKAKSIGIIKIKDRKQ